MKYAVSAPTPEPISLVEAKAHLRIDNGDLIEDGVIVTPLITAAREYCENITGRALAPQTITAYPDDWGPWRLPRPPVVSIESIKYYDRDSAEYTLETSAYQLDKVGNALFILKTPAVSLREINPIEIVYKAGEACPMAVRQAMLLLIGHWYQSREAIAQAGIKVYSVELELGVKRLLNQYKVWWL